MSAGSKPSTDTLKTLIACQKMCLKKEYDSAVVNCSAFIADAPKEILLALIYLLPHKYIIEILLSCLENNREDLADNIKDTGYIPSSSCRDNAESFLYETRDRKTNLCVQTWLLNNKYITRKVINE